MHEREKHQHSFLKKSSTVTTLLHPPCYRLCRHWLFGQGSSKAFLFLAVCVRLGVWFWSIFQSFWMWVVSVLVMHPPYERPVTNHSERKMAKINIVHHISLFDMEQPNDQSINNPFLSTKDATASLVDKANHKKPLEILLPCKIHNMPPALSSNSVQTKASVMAFQNTSVPDLPNDELLLLPHAVLHLMHHIQGHNNVWQIKDVNSVTKTAVIVPCANLLPELQEGSTEVFFGIPVSVLHRNMKAMPHRPKRNLYTKPPS